MGKGAKKLLIISVCVIAVSAVALFLVLPYFGINVFSGLPDYIILDNTVEAGTDYDVSDRIVIKDDDKDDWLVTLKEDSIDASKLGRYTAVYIFKSKSRDKEYDLEVSYEVVEGEIPKILQKVFEYEYGDETEFSKIFTVSNIKDYKYEIDSTGVDLNTIGKYSVYVRLWSKRGFDETFEYKLEVVDNQAPTLKCPKTFEILQGEVIDVAKDVRASDNYDGDITQNVIISGDSDFSQPGEYYIKYSVSDSSDNIQEGETKVLVYGVAELGNEFTINNWTITVNDWHFEYRIDDRDSRDNIYYYYEADEGMVYVVLDIEVKNNSANNDCFVDSAKYISDEIAKITFDDKLVEECLGYSLANNLTDSEFNLVKPGESAEGKLYFYMDEAAKLTSKSLVLCISDNRSWGPESKIYIIFK
jgi:hypothetical protein